MATQQATSNGHSNKSPKSDDGAKAVSVLLEPEVHDYYAQQAAEDERTLNKYLARLIKQDYQAAQAAQAAAQAAAAKSSSTAA